MKNTLRNILFFAVAAFFMQSCVSNKAFQTARVTPQGEKGWGMGISLPTGEYIDTSGIFNDTITTGGFAGEFFGRFGVTEKVDVGVNLTLIGTGGADVKYQFLGDAESNLAASIGAGFGYLTIGGSTDDSDPFRVIDITVPAYVSYHPSSAIGLYVSPRYTYRKFGDDSTGFIGGIAGLRVGGESSGMFLEYGYLKGNGDIFSNQTQLNIGFGIGIR